VPTEDMAAAAWLRQGPACCGGLYINVPAPCQLLVTAGSAALWQIFQPLGLDVSALCACECTLACSVASCGVMSCSLSSVGLAVQLELSGRIMRCSAALHNQSCQAGWRRCGILPCWAG
jgi:hypothetical protein